MISQALILLSAISVSALTTEPMTAPPAANGEIIGIVEQVKGGKTTRIRDAVVSLEAVQGSFAAPSKPVDLDQKDKEFIPHVIAVMKGTTVRFISSDPFFHNVFSSSRVQKFNVSQEKKGDVSNVLFDKVGIVPIRCHIHANMKAYVVVLGNPYFDVSNAQGQIRIADVPAGSYTIKVWGEKFASQTQTVVVPASGQGRVIFKVNG